jgi:hypothetical protein
VLRVPAGTEVKLVNRDDLTHPLGRPGGDWYWDGNAGDRTSVRLDASGVYPFFCYQHPGMVGVVVVGDGAGTGGAAVLDAAATVAAPAPAARTTPTQPGAAAVPPAWLLVVALAALVGAAGGARLASRRRAP